MDDFQKWQKKKFGYYTNPVEGKEIVVKPKGWEGESTRHSLARYGIKTKGSLHRLKGVNGVKGRNYKYYSVFTSPKGTFVIRSGDKKRYYIDSGRDSNLIGLPNSPFKNATDAKNYLNKRISNKSNFPIGKDKFYE